MEATFNTEPTFEKIVLMLDATPGMRAPAVTATKPAINAYSMRSWPWVSPHRNSLYRIAMAKWYGCLGLWHTQARRPERRVRLLRLLPLKEGSIKTEVAHPSVASLNGL